MSPPLRQGIVSEPCRLTDAAAGHGPIPITSGRVADLEVAASLAEAEPFWRALEACAPHSVYQSFEFCLAWQSHLGAARGVTPLLVTGIERASGLRFLLPLGLRRYGPLRVASFLGGKHANYKFGLFEGAVPTSGDSRAMSLLRTGGELQIAGATLLEALTEAGQRARIDAFALFGQPAEWSGRPNPLATALPCHGAASSRTWRASLEGGYEAFYARMRGSTARKRLRWRRRKLGEAGPLRLHRARTAEEAIEITDMFLAQKRQRFAGRVVRNAFEEEAAVAFLRSLAASVGRTRPSIDLYALRAGDAVAGTFGGGSAAGHFSGYFISIDGGALARFGPGEVILADVIQTICQEGATSFDLGIGDSAYKALWCDPETLRDAVLPVTAAGRSLAPLVLAARRAKARLKRDGRTEAQIDAILDRRAAGEDADG